MKKRNFWMKCLAFMLVVVMILSEQNITTLGETIGDYTQERMAASSEKKSKNIASENHSKETPEENGSSDETSGETSANQNNSQENQKKQQNNSEQGNVTDNQGTGTSAGQTSLDKNTSSGDDANNQNQIESSANINENKTENKNDADKDKADKKDDADQEKKEDNAGDDQDAGNKQQEKQAEQQSAPAPNLSNNTGAQPTQSAPKKDKKQKKADAKAGDDTQGAEENNGKTLQQVVEENYGKNGAEGSQKVANVTITKRGDKDQTDVKAGGTVSYEISYHLLSAVYFDYGEISEPLFDTYNNTKIILHLPKGLTIDEDAEGTLQNVTSIEGPVDKGDYNDWTLNLNNSIKADSDKSGTFLVTLQVDGNGSLDVGHEFDFGEGSNLAQIQTEFTIMDRTGASDKPAEGIDPYTKTIATESTLTDLEAVTDDEWMIEKEAAGFTPNADGTVTVKYNLSIGLKTTENGQDSIISDAGIYGREGRATFDDTFTYGEGESAKVYPAINLTETPEVTGRNGNKIDAASITVTPQFDDLDPIPITINDGNTTIPLDTCEGQATGATVDNNAPYLSNYTVEVVYNNYEGNFVANYYDPVEKQEKLDVVNNADITYQFKGETDKHTDKSEATQPVGDVTEPAAIDLSKYIVD